MRKVYVGLVALLFLAILAQFYFAAVGAFAKPQDDKSFALHDVNGMAVIPAIAVLATIAAALSRAGGRLIGLTILPALLVIVQMLINLAGGHDNDHTTPAGLAILGLHALNGLAIMAVTRVIFLRARDLLRAPRPAARSEAGAPVPAR